MAAQAPRPDTDLRGSVGCRGRSSGEKCRQPIRSQVRGTTEGCFSCRRLGCKELAHLVCDPAQKSYYFSIAVLDAHSWLWREMFYVVALWTTRSLHVDRRDPSLLQERRAENDD